MIRKMNAKIPESVFLKNRLRILSQLDQPSLGMPSREYYLKEEERSYKDAYLKYMVNVACLLGANETLARLDMAEVLAFEVELAKVPRFL